jgi:hypothetical protein
LRDPVRKRRDNPIRSTQVSAASHWRRFRFFLGFILPAFLSVAPASIYGRILLKKDIGLSHTVWLPGDMTGRWRPVDGEDERMSALQDRERSRWIPIFEKHFATAECGLRLGEMQETGWHTILAELVDKKGEVFLLAEVDFDTEELLRCRRPSAAVARA